MIAGIDGGGTSTRLELRREDNTGAERMKFGPFNISAIGPEGVRKVIGEIAARTDLSALSRVCVGGAGASCAGLGSLLEETMGAYGFHGRLRVCTDSEIALRGAMEGPGGILIAGTGSIAWGMNGEGKTVRVGGWGHLIDDEGSGYTIGRDALRAAVRTQDGRAEAETLRSAVLARIGGKDNHSILDYVYYSGRDKSATAALASVVIGLAGEGDPVSLRILEKNADELAGLARAMAAGLGMDRPRVALLGGLLETENPYSEMVKNKLRAVCETAAPEHDALWGAAQLAREMD